MTLELFKMIFQISGIWGLQFELYRKMEGAGNLGHSLSLNILVCHALQKKIIKMGTVYNLPLGKKI